MCSTFYTSSNLPDNNLDILSITVYRFNFIGCLQMYNKYISSISLSNKKPQLSTCMTRRKKKIVKCGFFSICIFCRNVFFFLFFFFFENQTCGQRKDKEKEVLTIKRWWTGLLWERLWDWNLSNCWKFAGKFRGREERERGDKKREREDNFSKPMRINRITDEKALKPAFMWERMSESWKL